MLKEGFSPESAAETSGYTPPSSVAPPSMEIPTPVAPTIDPTTVLTPIQIAALGGTAAAIALIAAHGAGGAVAAANTAIAANPAPINPIPPGGTGGGTTGNGTTGGTTGNGTTGGTGTAPGENPTPGGSPGNGTGGGTTPINPTPGSTPGSTPGPPGGGTAPIEVPIVPIPPPPVVIPPPPLVDQGLSMVPPESPVPPTPPPPPVDRGLSMVPPESPVPPGPTPTPPPVDKGLSMVPPESPVPPVDPTGLTPEQIAALLAAGYILANPAKIPSVPTRAPFPIPTFNGAGLVNPGVNPGFIEPAPAYGQQPPGMDQYYWGQHQYAQNMADLANLNNPAPTQPYGNANAVHLGQLITPEQLGYPNAQSMQQVYGPGYQYNPAPILARDQYTGPMSLNQPVAPNQFGTFGPNTQAQQATGQGYSAQYGQGLNYIPGATLIPVAPR